MPNLHDLLAQSMLFTAASAGKSDGNSTLEEVDIGAPVRTPEPQPTTARQLKEFGKTLDEHTVRANQIWRFSWDPSSPGVFTDITIKSRGMGMDYGMPCKVYDRLEFQSISIVRTGGTKVDLPLSSSYMLRAWHTRLGHIRPFADNFIGKANPLWQLDARIDHSMLVAFGYKLDGSAMKPLSLAECDAFGEDLIPTSAASPQCEFIADPKTPGVVATVCVGASRYIALVELVLCKEHNDFVPGGFVGFARIHPHAMVWSNESVRRVESTIVMARPKHGMSHGESMHKRHKALVVTDTNYPHSPSAKFGPFPIPFADAIYDYFEVEPAKVFASRAPADGDHPQQRTGEITLADARFTTERTLSNVVHRHSRFTDNDADIVKQPRQGQFDNVHIGVRMRLSMTMPDGPEFPWGAIDHKNVLVDDDLSMIFQCLHDCCHMHVRWSAMFDDRIIAGWSGGKPNALAGAPAVPENQTVFASFPDEHTLVYRAIAEKVAAGELSIFCHHGLAYAVDQWPTASAMVAMEALHLGLKVIAEQVHEPYWNGEPNDPWSLFYFRIRYCGAEIEPGKWKIQQRLTFKREECMK